MKVFKRFNFALSFIGLLVFTLISFTNSQATSLIFQKVPDNVSDSTSPPSTDGGIHDFTGLPLTGDGWTNFLAMFAHPDHYKDTRVIYVSTSGNDGTAKHYTIDDPDVGSDPFSPSGAISPYKTLAAGYNQLRSGYPDVMLLKRGDVWTEDLPQWRKSGRSRAEFMILGAYGSLGQNRPKVGEFRTGFGPNNPERAFSHTFFSGVEFGAISRTIFGENFFIEDCATLKRDNTGIRISGSGGRLYDVVIRRSVIAERYPTDSTGHTQGMFVSGTTGLLVEESIFDHNGWTDDPNLGNPATIHNHNTYFDIGVKDTIMRYNISTRSSSKGYQPGGGGLVVANLSVNDPIGIESSRAEAYVPDGLDSVIKDNVILEGKDSKTSSVTRWGIRFTNVASSWVEGNILGTTTGSGRQAMYLDTFDRNGTWMYVRNVTLKDNIVHNWGGTIRIEGSGIENVVLQGNKVHNDYSTALVNWNSNTKDQITSSGNSFYSSQLDPAAWLAGYRQDVGDTTSVVGQTFPTGGYLVPDYLASIGEAASLESFFSKIKQQRRGNWDERYTAVPIINFVRGKFGKPPVTRAY